MSSTLAGHTVLIVGGTSGVGFAVASASLLNRAKHVIVASSSPERVQSAVSRLHEAAAAAVRAGTLAEVGTVVGEVLDANDLGAVRTFCERIGEVDHLVWTAGGSDIFAIPKEVEATKDFLNLRVWSGLQAARSIKIRPGGSFTLTMGMAHKRPPPGLSAIATMHCAIEGLTRGLAVDLAPARVNTVSLGYIATELLGKLPKEAQEHIGAEMQTKSLVGRAGTADEVAEAYLYLMKCKYVTGTIAECDGGMSIMW